MKLKDMKFPRKKAICCLSVAVALMSALTGCTEMEVGGEKKYDSVQEAVEHVQSVEVSVSLELQGNYNGSDDYGTHTAVIRSDGTITSTRAPAQAYHSEFYSSVIVDGATTREGREVYVVPDGDGYTRYEYAENSEEWHRSSVSQSDILSIPSQTGLFDDWDKIMEVMNHDETIDVTEEKSRLIYSGYIPSNLLQELFGNNVFGSFMYSVEQLVSDELPCILTVDEATNLPESLEIDFANEWRVSDMEFEMAYITVSFANWNQILEIKPDKKVSVSAIDTEEEFYSTYYAWNLFLPYIGGDVNENSNNGQLGQTFSSSWNTFQIRIDGGMIGVPLDYENLQRIGYSIDDQYSSTIIEPNKYIERIAVVKGNDKLYCTFYNDTTSPQPINNCKIGSIDVSAANMPDKSIQIYLPGEVTMGISKDDLLNAYGDPVDTSASFACDTLTWKNESDLQSFMAEISIKTGKVIRLELRNIPVTGGPQI